MVYIIAAVAENSVIGKAGNIPWKIKGEQKRFRELTTGNVVVMGRRSFEEIGKPLPNRENVIISATKNFDEPGCKTVKSLAEALELYKDQEIYISGGARLYREALPLADKLYITKVHKCVKGDVYFPEYNDEQFIVTEAITYSNAEIPYTYYTLERTHQEE